MEPQQVRYGKHSAGTPVHGEFVRSRSRLRVRNRRDSFVVSFRASQHRLLEKVQCPISVISQSSVHNSNNLSHIIVAALLPVGPAITSVLNSLAIFSRGDIESVFYQLPLNVHAHKRSQLPREPGKGQRRENLDDELVRTGEVSSVALPLQIRVQRRYRDSLRTAKSKARSAV